MFIRDLSSGVLLDFNDKPLINSFKSAVNDSLIPPGTLQLYLPQNHTERLIDNIGLSGVPVENDETYRMQPCSSVYEIQIDVSDPSCGFYFYSIVLKTDNTNSIEQKFTQTKKYY